MQKTDDFVVVQGIIDVYFEEEDKIILVDYKTDRVREGEEDIFDTDVIVHRWNLTNKHWKRSQESV
mgnify:CR=1 FL=1